MKFKLQAKLRRFKTSIRFKHGIIREIMFSPKNPFHIRIFKKEHILNNALFIHIPKSAGRSISTALLGNDKLGHYFASDYQKNDPTLYAKLFKFTFVRNPEDRLWSAYHYLIDGGGNESDKSFGEQLKKETNNFNDFVINWLNHKRINTWPHFVPQNKYTHKNGKPIVDFIGRYENLQVDFEKVAKNLNNRAILSWENEGRTSKSRPKEISKEAREKIVNLYKEDYHEFNYKHDQKD